MKKTLAIVLLSSLLSACAGMQSPSEQASTQAADKKKMSDQAKQSSARTLKNKAKASQLQEDPLPNVDLNEDILFKIMTSEIAFQRGQWQAAFATLMSTAKQTRDPRLARRAAEMAIAVRSPREALAAVHLWTQLAPHSSEAQQNYLGLIMLNDNLADMEPILVQQLKDASPQVRPIMMLQMQAVMMRAKNKAAAFAMIERVLTPYAPIFESHLGLAQAAFANGDLARAKQETLAAQRIKPASELAILTLAQVTPDPAQSMQLISDYLKQYPKADEVRVAYARSLVEQKQYEQADTQFQIILKNNPDDPQTLFSLGVLSAQNNKLNESETYLKRFLDMIEAHPETERDPTPALLLLSQIAEQRKDVPQALKWLEKVEPGEAYGEVQMRRALLLVSQKDIEGARKVLQQAQSESDNDHDKVLLIESEAQILRDNQRAPEAAALLQESLKHFPNNPELLYDYAMVQEKLGDMTAMEAALRTTMAVAPANKHAYNALGYSLADRNERLPEALKLINIAHKLAPDDAFINDSLGWVQFRMGNLKEAEDNLRRAYQAQRDPDVAAHLGEVLWTAGNKEEALAIWREAHKKEPGNEALNSTLTRLKIQL
ncbi:tetratricopeptide repeat protein [Herbaspirillum sp. RTI4]|uniref:tetratricopeptide repeat protein n=1 Tax=Herbaspirillum sp. RTI4 TaxID=3048640 RepID=UPI002AB3B765|nr:tetratricopeptide repeat protein [Herbaspirillum sp. RTI4]MDY7577851.1 tetratricopeptide repeat protein [Herbaspirillum sp. RTI4]MEA9982469.1 tetratricopeptide repeat protein [Herbaspirillum sp. RTI4]